MEGDMSILVRQLQSRIAKQGTYIARLEDCLRKTPTDSQDFLRRTLEQARKDQKLDKTIFRRMINDMCF